MDAVFWFVQGEVATNQWYVAHPNAGRLPIQFNNAEQALALCRAINAPIRAEHPNQRESDE